MTSPVWVNLAYYDAPTAIRFLVKTSSYCSMKTRTTKRNGFRHLQEQQRGEIVGEKTAGAANPGRPYPVNPHFEVTVPNGQVLMAITGRNWEGVGVAPDIAVPATEALRVAHIHALRSSLSATPNGSWVDSLRRELEALEAQRKRR